MTVTAAGESSAVPRPVPTAIGGRVRPGREGARTPFALVSALSLRWNPTGSYIALFTGFYVDNGPRLPLWDRLPHWSYWVIPEAIGIPLTWWALRRFRAGISARPRAGSPSAAPPNPRR
jgi:hypothetical protein